MNQLRRTSVISASALTIAIIWASLDPSGGDVVAGHHRSAHLVSYAMLAFAWRIALARLAGWLVALFVIAFGFLQEGIEIFGHSHSFEVKDALINALGAIVGVGFAHVGVKWLGTITNPSGGESQNVSSDD